MSIGVAGGGIAGTATAIALARKGFEVAVFEQSAAGETAGAGIQIGPNAARALQAIGAYEAVMGLTTAPRALAIHNGETGALLTEIPFGRRFEARYGAPYRVAHRADLLNALRRTAAAHRRVSFRHDSRVAAVTAERGGRQRLVLADGSAHEFAAVIGGDGIRSMVRAKLLCDGPPAVSGHLIYRTLLGREATPRGIDADQVCLFLLPNAHAVTYAVAGGSLVNLVVVVAGHANGHGWSAPAEPAEPIAALARRAPVLDALLHAAPSWTRFTGADRPPAARWGEGTVTLIGDAAHPALPFLAQGAAMALEDAAVLGQLAGSASIEDTFRAYERQRLARTARLTLAARRQGSLYHHVGPRGRLRDVVLRLIPGPLAIRRLDWLYGWHPPADVNAI
jgi:2-polyprenyl-6-methoxyphenol hydroxylase-like FAD-dependent oxidoreductase